MAVDVERPTLDVNPLADWLGDRLGDPALPLRAEPLGTALGMGNALFELRRGESVWVLRRPPAVLNDKSASNMTREYRILRALDGSRVPHPVARALCEDPAVIGAPFLIMDKIDGFTPGFTLPEPFGSDPSLRRGLAEAYVDALVELADVDWRARGLENLGKPEGFLERQVPRWLAQLDRYRVRDLPELDFVTDWLERNRPAMSPAAIIHGDYSPFNVMVAPEPPPRLAAVIDWDTGTIGDPLLDIGHLLGALDRPGRGAGVGSAGRRQRRTTRRGPSWPRGTPSGPGATCRRSRTTRLWRCSSWLSSSRAPTPASSPPAFRTRRT